MTAQTLTPASIELFDALWEDAPNWSGTPPTDGNIEMTAEERGNLTQLKRAGLLTTFKSDGMTWVDFTDQGRAFGQSREAEGNSEMTTATENSKIAEAMKGRAQARKRSPKERITSAPTSVGGGTVVDAKTCFTCGLSYAGTIEDHAESAEHHEIVDPDTVQGRLSAPATDRPATPAPKPTAKAKASKKTPAKRPVLTDEQKAERDRLGHVFILAKWARERAEKAQARINADKGMSPEDRKAAKALVIERLTAEATARKAWDASKKG